SPQPGTSTAAALDGNAAANRTALSSTITVTVNNGQEVWLRWKDINDANNDHGLAIDDVSVTANGAAATPTPTPTPSLSINDVTQAEGGAGVTDGQGLGTITNDDVTLTAIHTIQGSGTASPLVGQSVTTRGIVTGIKVGSSGGFFIQEPDATVDADPNTSEGVFVFTGSSVPAAAVVGNLVQVNGTVQEFIPSADTHQHPETELSGTITASVLTTGNAIPGPHVITAAAT